MKTATENTYVNGMFAFQSNLTCMKKHEPDMADRLELANLKSILLDIKTSNHPSEEIF